MTTAGQLRAIAQDILDQIEGWDDNTRIHTRCNTYGMGQCFIAVSDGFIDWSDIQEDYDDEEEDEE